MLLRGARLVPVGGAAPEGLVDLRVRDGRVSAVEPGLAAAAGEQERRLDGRWVIPGLWDAHVHLGQWARQATRLDVSGTACAEEVAARVSTADGHGLLVGGGYRPAAWPHPPTVGGLDRVTGARPVVLVSGDAHAGWLNTAALRLLGLRDRDEPVVEAEWFDVLPRVLAMEDAAVGPGAYTDALLAAARVGVVGVCDFEFERGFDAWVRRYPAVGVPLRVRTSTYPVDLDAAIGEGLRTGDRLLPEQDLLTMGSLKIISDGSLNTRTASCCEPYPDGGHGVQNVSPDDLALLLGRAQRHGLEVALHAIGDAAVGRAVAAFEQTGAAGSIEHAQLLRPAQVEAMSRAGLVASIQPAHLLDDRPVIAALWGEQRAARSYAFRDLASAGVRLALGSDAPVAPLDPWLAMAAAVHRGEPGEAAWHPEQSLTASEALASSTDGRTTVEVGAPADLAVLDSDPMAPGDPAEIAARWRDIRVAATLVAGRMVHDAL